MRVYVAATKADIDQLASGQNIAGRPGYALLPQWQNTQNEEDQEVLAETLLIQSAEIDVSTNRRIALVIETNPEVIEAILGEVSVAEFSQKQILAMFADDLTNKQAILSGVDPLELDLTWFGSTEIQQFQDFLDQE